MIGMNVLMLYSIIITSMAKMTPAMGVLNEAEMAAAQPHPVRMRTLLLGKRAHWPSKLPPAAPRCTAGPSLPMDSPPISVAAAPKNCTSKLRALIAPW